jgi:hypothetical protein
MHELEIIVKKQGEQHKVAASNGWPIFADLISLASADARKRFAQEVGRLAPGISAADVEAELLRLAVEESRPPTDRNAVFPEKSRIVSVSVPVPFPAEALPKVLRDFVCAMAEAMGVPPEVVAVPALVVCAAAVGNAVRCWITASWQEPCILWLALLMESGEMKTPSFKAAKRPMDKLQSKAEQEYQDKLAHYGDEQAQYDLDYASWKKSKGMGDPPVKPEPPMPLDYYTSDGTVESMALMQQANPRGVALLRDELSGFLASFGQYKQGRGGDEAAWLELYTCGTLKVNRVGKRIFVRNASASICGTCQPAVFHRAVRGGRDGDGNQIENGLVARFGVAQPIMPPKIWRDGTLPAGACDRYAELVEKLMSIPLKIDEAGDTRPCDIPLDTEALSSTFAVFRHHA